MSDNLSSNKRIAKNTLLLYARMLFSMIVSLYTSRVVLATLGVDDYGLYNVVGGVVTMFTFISLAMGNSTNRYITFALGKGDEEELKQVVSAACVIHWVIAILTLILAETVGLWFLYNKMVIPEGRMVAAEWVYQFSIIACVLSIINVPYNAMIIAHEKMGAFAFISVLVVIMKLLIAFLIQITSYDKLIFYAALILCLSILERAMYQIYCVRHFEEAKKIKFTTKYPHFKDMTSFAGWSMIGNLIMMGYTQGVNILLNLFFGPAVNAARGVTFQVQNAMMSFVRNFQTALNPQLIKSYAQKDYQRQLQLLYTSSKFSFFLMLCMVLPVFVEADGILHLWLKEVPAYSTIFLRLVLLISLVPPLDNPICTSNNATGDIKKYQIIVGSFNILIVIFAYIVLKLGFEPYSVFVVQLTISVIVLFIEILLVKEKIHLSIKDYITNVLFRIIAVTAAAIVIPFVIHVVAPSESVIRLMVNCIIGAVSTATCSFFIGMTTRERTVILDKAKNLLGKTLRRGI